MIPVFHQVRNQVWPKLNQVCAEYRDKIYDIVQSEVQAKVRNEVRALVMDKVQ